MSLLNTQTHLTLFPTPRVPGIEHCENPNGGPNPHPRPKVLPEASEGDGSW